MQNYKENRLKDSIGISGYVTLKHFRNGKLLSKREGPNQIQNNGKALFAALLTVDVGETGVDYIAIGTGTGQAVTATALATEIAASGGSRRGAANLTGTRETTTVTDDTAQFVTTFTFTGTLAVTEAALFNANSGGDMPAYQDFTAVNVVSGDTLEITWKVVFA